MLRAHRVELGRERPDALCVDVEAGDRRALPGEQERSAPPDALAETCDDYVRIHGRVLICARDSSKSG